VSSILPSWAIVAITYQTDQLGRPLKIRNHTRTTQDKYENFFF